MPEIGPRDEFANRSAAIPHFLRKKPWRTNGLRFRDETGRWVVDRRPQGYKKKLSLGSYKKKKDALIAIDFCNFQTLKQPAHEDFNYNCSPDFFSNLPRLRMDFQSLDPKCPDDAHCHYSREMRERIDQLIRQDEEVHWTGWKYWIPMDNGNASGPSFPQLNLPPLDIIPEGLHIIPESYPDVHEHVLEEPHSADSEGPSRLSIIPESYTDIHQHILEEPSSADSEGPSRLYIIPESYTDIHQHVLEEGHLAAYEGPRGLHSIPESYTDIRQCVLEEPHLADFEGVSRLYIIPESCTGIHHVLEEPHLADSEGPSRLYIIPESYTDIHQHVLEEGHLEACEGPRGLLSNQWEAVVHNLPSHVERYNLADLIPGLPIETGAFLLGTVHLHPERQ
ncbi:unnamed protein product [Sphagnum troendelagicum]|uniref:AP2/ERF domain-containing protein n=1 Tax=Sphagnum troendelagicum TaxID=128251 RepID=A0ABP0U0Z0_9BRYO